MDIVTSLGWTGIMLCIGMLLRAKISFFQKMLVPASVLAGIVGMLVMNSGFQLTGEPTIYNDIVNQLFTISFISIGLTRPKSQKNGLTASKAIIKGATCMGLVWCILYALTPVVGYLLISLVGSQFNFNSIYGSLIPFAFAQGPGQAAAFGALYEQYGWPNAAMVGITFAAFGFLAAFLIGVPLARLGIKKRIAKNCGEIDASILKGYFTADEQHEFIGKETTYSGNIETLSYHFAVIGLCYTLAVGSSKLTSLIPGFWGETMSGMLFMHGMLMSYFIRWLIKKLKLEFLQDNTLQSKITGWTADLLVVCSFMAVQFRTVSQWIIPIILECVLITAITVAVCLYFGPRFGGENDFERTLALYGTSTGTVPSGIALIRIVDPQLKTTTYIELGMMNVVMLLCTPIYFILLAMAGGKISHPIALAILTLLIILYSFILKITNNWNKKSFSLK